MRSFILNLVLSVLKNEISIGKVLFLCGRTMYRLSNINSLISDAPDIHQIYKQWEACFPFKNVSCCALIVAHLIMEITLSDE